MTNDMRPPIRDEFPDEAADRRFAEIMRTIEDDAAIDPAQDWFEALRNRSLAEFACESTVNLPDRIRPSRSQGMFALMFRFVTAAAVCSAVVGASFLAVTRETTVAGSVTFAEVLSQLQEADTWQLKVVRGAGENLDIFVRSAGQVRCDDSDGSYRIAHGSRLWHVNPTEQAVVESESPWYDGPDSPVDLLRLLEIGELESGPLLKARPMRREQLDGKDCVVYDVRLTVRRARDAARHGDVLHAFTAVDIEAFVEASTQRLVELRAWPPLADRAARTAPLAELRMIAFNPEVPDDKFAVNESLADDGRLGTISDSQGVVVLRPALAKRWTPVARDAVVKPGDWLRSDRRGANAVKVTLTTAVELTLGPATLVEFVTAEQVRLHEGFVRVRIPKVESRQPRLEVLAPRGAQHREFTQAGDSLLRTDAQEQLVNVRESPKWLTGFDGTTTRESLGSLIVNLPDGRSEPLSVGFHRVSVEIRDQIARTTIEESFVNHTDSRLEGVFHFPLPQDASISGFGMWIGNDLVEADIVEKQRAREIYETILRERRDPGLLEWTSGNEFKARVFPIEARSEKRVRIVYTQVLPLRANHYRYSYGLRSELLRNRPLRELSIDVTIASAIPLKKVSCASHAVRTLSTRNTARIEFSAQEYTPTRDFELACEIDAKQSDVVVVPHRRGDDGYFLLQLTPPLDDGAWRQEVSPEGAPVSLAILCDTSASMSAEKRREQAEFVAALLASLGPDDRFLLGAVDVDAAWASEKPLTPGDQANDDALKFLHDRVSLGWTDLEKAMREAVRNSPPGTQLIYVGDGIPTAGTAADDTDGPALVKRVERLLKEGKNVDRSQASRKLHTVMVGNSNDAFVMRGLATAGGGSARTISGEQTGQVVARELLHELVRPGVSDLRVEFKGWKVAAVYPETIPNLPAGAQQILVGRYLPDGKDQRGEIVVTGKRGNEPVRFVARVELADAETGNSFVPRLWARQHLDRMLAQGTSDSIRDEIIGLSEEFHIITPYTSLLVLETDADRQRFGVKRRFEMRDGERFFSEGRAQVNFELVQAQAKRAADWRLELRQAALKALARVGRDPSVYSQLAAATANREIFQSALDETESLDFNTASLHRLDLFSGKRPSRGRAFGGGLGGWSGNARYLGGQFLGRSSSHVVDFENVDQREFWGFEGLSDSLSNTFDAYSRIVAAGSAAEGFKGMSNGEDVIELQVGQAFDANWSDQLQPVRRSIRLADSIEELGEVVVGAKRKLWDHDGTMDEVNLGLSLFADQDGLNLENQTYSGLGDLAGIGAAFGRDKLNRRGNMTASFVAPRRFDAIFPRPSNLSRDAIRKFTAPPGWSPDAVKLADQLLRREVLAKKAGGWAIRRDTTVFSPEWNRQTARRAHSVLSSTSAWLTRSDDIEAETVVEYCVDGELGCYSRMTGLGATRVAKASDLRALPLGFDDGSLVPHYANRKETKAAIEPVREGEVKLVIRSTEDVILEEVVIDTSRKAARRIQFFDDGRPSSARVYDNFTEVEGLWIATVVSHRDRQDREVARVAVDIQSLDDATFTQRMRTELADRSGVLFARRPGVDPQTAQQIVADGKAGVDEYLSLMNAEASRQQWDAMRRWLEALDRVARGPDGSPKEGMRWLRIAADREAGRNEQFRERLLAEARRVANAATQGKLATDAQAVSHRLWSEIRGVAAPDECLELLKILEPVHQRQTDEGKSLRTWMEWMAIDEERAGRLDQALAWREKVAVSAPWHVNAQVAYGDLLKRVGRFPDALAWMRREWNRPVERSGSERELFGYWMCEQLRKAGQWDELIAFAREWSERQPSYQLYHGPYEHYLAALVFANKLDEAYRTADGWLRDARVPEKLSPVLVTRLEAVLRFAEGNLPNLNVRRRNPRWIGPMAESAKYYLERENHGHWFSRTMGYSELGDSEIADEMRGKWLERLRSASDSLAPYLVERMVSYTLHDRVSLEKPLQGRRQLNGAEVSDEVWRPIAETLRQRWRETKIAKDKQSLANALQDIHARRFERDEYLAFLRERLSSADQERRSEYRRDLYVALLAEPWTPEREREVLQLFRETVADRGQRPAIAVVMGSMINLVDKLLNARLLAAEHRFRDQGGLDKLTRTEVQQKSRERAQAERTALSDRLAEMIRDEQAILAKSPPGDGDREKETSEALIAGLRLEQMWLDVQLERNQDACEQYAWRLLGETPAVWRLPARVDSKQQGKQNQPVQDDASSGDLSEADEVLAWRQFTQTAFESLARHRALAIVLSSAMRKSAPPAGIERVLKFLEAGERVDADSRDAWRGTRYLLLVALDRADGVEQAVRGWIREDKSLSPWRIALAQLLAERGNLQEAVAIFESCRGDGLLGGNELALLAEWQNALGRRDDFERTRWEAMLETPESTLNRRLSQYHGLLTQRGGLTSSLDESAPLSLRALFKKSSSPNNYLDLLGGLYSETRDARLLRALSDCLLGHTPQAVYDALGGVRSRILAEVRNEAGTDEISERIVELRKGQLTPLDLRALDLLETLVESRAAEVVNQPTGHRAAALAALRRSFDRQWSAGEPPLMANFLRQIGKLPATDLADEQLRQLKTLVPMAPEGSRERLQMTEHLCVTLFWSYGRRADALPILEQALSSYEGDRRGAWPHEDNQHVDVYVSMLQDVARHADGERLLLHRIATSLTEEQRRHFEDRLSALYIHALEQPGPVSLTLATGREKLLGAMIDRWRAAADKADSDAMRQAIVGHWVKALEAAVRLKIPQAKEAVEQLAFKDLPRLLSRQSENYVELANSPTAVIEAALGNRELLRYRVERLERYPRRFDDMWNSVWQNLGNGLEGLRDAKEGDLLEHRAFMLIDERLKVALRSERYLDDIREFTHKSYSGFWSQRADEFAETAEEVLRESPQSGRRAVDVARYLHQGLHRESRAIEVLAVAAKAGILDDSAISQLAQWLSQAQRSGEAIGLWESLVERHPQELSYRSALLEAYHAANRPAQYRQLFDATMAAWHREGRWTEEAMAELGRVALRCSESRQSCDLLNEAIASRRLRQGSEGRGDATLSGYYQDLASAHSALGETAKAVEAASGAIVCWTSRHRQQADAIRTLETVLKQSQDLEAFAKHLDAEAERTGQDSPLVRRALGAAHQVRKEYREAIVQFRVAVALQPSDRRLHEALVECLDASGEREAATDHLLRRVEFNPSDLEWMKKIATRLKDDPQRAERAVTNIIELAPQEASHHGAVAEIRQTQNRWQEALGHWRRVAALRRLEPTGLIQAAAAEIELKRWEDAKRTLDELDRTEWPKRFEDLLRVESPKLRAKLPK